MKKNDTLAAKLARSLDQQNKKRGPEAAAKPPVVEGRHCKKINISLFQTDLQKVEGIRLFMQTHGQYINTSTAFKLALRTAPLSADLLKAYEEIKGEDGRRGENK